MRLAWFLGGLVLIGCDGGTPAPPPRPSEPAAPVASLAAVASLDPAAAWKELADALAGPEAEAKVRALIGRGFDPAAAGPEGERALVLAARAKRHEVLRLLLQEARVDPDQREEERGETALMAAAAAVDSAAIDLLLRAGADPTLVSGPWDPPHEQLETARQLLVEAEGDPALIERLVEGLDERSGNKGGIVLLDRVVLIPPPGGLLQPVKLRFGRSTGEWGALEYDVQRDPVVDESGTSLIESRRGAQLVRVELRWQRGAHSGRRDLVFNKPNAGEIGERSAMGAVSEIELPEGILRVEAELRPLEIE